MNILWVNSSARQQGSDSRALGAQLVDKFQQSGVANICQRDLNNDLHILDDEFLQAAYLPSHDRSPSQVLKLKMSDILVQELKNCDALILTLPMYNFNIPASLKIWQDLVMREGQTFKTHATGIKGLLNGKKAYIITTTGGVAHTSADYLLKKLTRLFLNGLGIVDQTYIYADNLAYDRQKNLDKAQTQIAELKL
ncbi:MAG: NAD(P)H-dependent oxidoreductase [Rhizobiales bacterium]|nr:NAD(P)H-dependent oxidoreductase [Hyphomicrobiales bacterium]NRB13015.1 NAD(P)H-dependent oxidoreductase [Hyphomicrobiales bacterium]